MVIFLFWTSIVKFNENWLLILKHHARSDLLALGFSGKTISGLWERKNWDHPDLDNRCQPDFVFVLFYKPVFQEDQTSKKWTVIQKLMTLTLDIINLFQPCAMAYEQSSWLYVTVVNCYLARSPIVSGFKCPIPIL
jgi:hypothetical protein